LNALVTGSAGFLGRHFTAALTATGHAVTAVDIDDPVHPRDTRRFFDTNQTRYDLVIHCAAVSPHRSAIDRTPLLAGACNLELDAAMFQWAADTRPGRVAYISSSAAYPRRWQEDDHDRIALREEDVDFEYPIGEPDGIYGWVKLTGEKLANAYRQQGGTVTVVRPFSGYGEGQTTDFPFGAFVHRAHRREDPFTIWGDGTQVRDWIHVDDVVAGTLAAVDAEHDGPINLCTGVGTSMEELAGLVCDAAGYSPAYELLVDAPQGVAYRVGDPTRLREIYEPAVTLEEGVKRALTT
jgi:nucleoside-diphosphate-sugar epimerase